MATNRLSKKLTGPFYDKTGREIIEGDLLKIFHFAARPHRRFIYMYRLVVRCNRSMQPDKRGPLLMVSTVCPLASVPLERAHRVFLSVVGECEIVSAAIGGDMDAFWERPTSRCDP